MRFSKILEITRGKESLVILRYKNIVKILNKSYWNIDCKTSNGRLVGSYGRGTAIHLSDIDMLFVLPNNKRTQYNSYQSNGQSSLLQEVRQSLLSTYPRTGIRADGQVVQVSFVDGMRFEIVPCFIKRTSLLGKVSTSYEYPDTNSGGSWKKTDPHPEINAIHNFTNPHLKSLCKMIRAWKDRCNVPMGGLLIDTLVYNFLSTPKNNRISRFPSLSGNAPHYGAYTTRDFFEYLSQQNDEQSYWYAVGSKQQIYPRGKFSRKAKEAYSKSEDAINFANTGEMKYAINTLREIYGPRFPNQ
ncbi:MAG: nucleotidyltransferase domain-containing protein [Akkermansia sp.]